MPPKKKKPEAPATRRSTRQVNKSRTVSSNNAIPDVYQEMLAEAAADISHPSPRPAKRRRISPDQVTAVDDLFESPSPPRQCSEAPLDLSEAPARLQQIVFDDFEGSDDSDVEFEDVDLEPDLDPESGEMSAAESEAEIHKPIQIDLSKPAVQTPRSTVLRRKPVTKAERSMRLDVHKWHFMSLLGHGLHRNAWCNSEEIHAILKPMVPRKLVKLLHTDESKPQYEQNYSFNKGVEEICLLWRQQWKTIIPGLRRPHWRANVDAVSEADESDDLDFDDFKSAARICRGSRDVGAQLFTALLRSIAVEARLVFSLQVLPFAGTAKAETPVKPRSKPDYILAPPQDYSVASSSTSPFVPPLAKLKKSKKTVDSLYPIFWTEILTPNKMWTPLDPIVRNTISKPKTQFEPPLSDLLNTMTYVMAYEDDNSVRDVTRRYAQWFNAKTRKLRIESTKNGEEWYTAALAVLSKKLREPRDEIEDDELSRRLNSEGMPHNIQDFKNHPVYVLERHMRANEVLQPMREVGKVNVGTAKNGKIEPVYRRQDVHLCRTSDAWYRRGRDVKIGEQPLKRVMPKSRRSGRGPSAELSDDENEGEDEDVGLYAMYQTDVYEPPPVVGGKIPKNAYGNLDVYVSSMIPAGAVHVSHPLAASAAKVLGTDFADAVTGFEFKGRKGTAIVNGVVVAEQLTAAIAATIQGLEQLGSEEVQQARSKILVSVWKRMLQALRVKQRVEAEYGSTELPSRTRGLGSDEDDVEDEDDPAYEEDGDDEAGGGFMLDDEPTDEKVQEQAVDLQVLKQRMPTVLPDEVISVPIAITRSLHKPPTVQKQKHKPNAVMEPDDDDLFDDRDQDHDISMSAGGCVPADEDTEMAGGFMPDTEIDDDNGGGGFIIDDEDGPEKSTAPATTRSIPMGKIVDNTDKMSTHSNTTMDMEEEEEEEDAALQLAIAESLMTKPSSSPLRDDGDHNARSNEPEANPDPTVSATADPNSTDVANDNPDEEEEEEEDNISDGDGSLMSHDPNEDDQDPEWLDEALD